MQKLRDQDIDSRFSFSKGNVWSNKSFSLLYFKTKVMAKENALLRNGKEPFRFHSHKSDPGVMALSGCRKVSSGAIIGILLPCISRMLFRVASIGKYEAGILVGFQFGRLADGFQ